MFALLVESTRLSPKNKTGPELDEDQQAHLHPVTDLGIEIVAVRGCQMRCEYTRPSNPTHAREQAYT